MNAYEREQEIMRRWLEDERLALHVQYSDERPEYGLWAETVLLTCSLILILVALYQVGNGLGLI